MSISVSAPKTVPTHPPRPPEKAVPPRTTATKTGSSMGGPTVGSPEPVCAVRNTPAAP